MKTIQRMWIMRKYLADMNPVEAMEFINDRFEKTKNNEDFFDLDEFLRIHHKTKIIENHKLFYKELTNLDNFDFRFAALFA